MTMPTLDPNAIAILGGTGDQGLGLALRFAKAGTRPVLIGSRNKARAEATATQLNAQFAELPVAVRGMQNDEATRRAGIVILSLPFEHTANTMKALRDHFQPGQVLVSMAVPLATALGDAPLRTVGVWQGSCAELVASLAPEGVEVVSAFQNVSAHRLQQLEAPVECDVVISGARAGRERVAELCALVPGLRAINGGPLESARYVEQWTALLIGLNRRYKTPEGLGFRFTGLPTPP